jgi:hypothetical protein
MSKPDSPRWEWEDSPQAATVDPWMRVGLGPGGKSHSVLVWLVRMRQSVANQSLDWAYCPLGELVAEFPYLSLDEDAMRSLLSDLAGHGMVETDLQAARWRATRAAVDIISAAYSERHPMTTDKD